jgi:hypothetical protein
MASLPSGGEQSDRDDYEYSTSDDDAEYSWIGWFCSRKGHEFLCEVQLMPNLCDMNFVQIPRAYHT